MTTGKSEAFRVWSRLFLALGIVREKKPFLEKLEQNPNLMRELISAFTYGLNG